jgi:hypothetical protein
MTSPDQSSVRNMLLHNMSAADFALLQPHLLRKNFELGAMIFEANTPLAFVQFLETGTASIVDEQEGGEMSEVGLYGYEGMSGASVALDAGHSPHRSMVQEGSATTFQIASGRLLDACRRALACRASCCTMSTRCPSRLRPQRRLTRNSHCRSGSRGGC